MSYDKQKTPTIVCEKCRSLYRNMQPNLVSVIHVLATSIIGITRVGIFKGIILIEEKMTLFYILRLSRH